MSWINVGSLPDSCASRLYTFSPFPVGDAIKTDSILRVYSRLLSENKAKTFVIGQTKLHRCIKQKTVVFLTSYILLKYSKSREKPEVNSKIIATFRIQMNSFQNEEL